MQINNIHTTNFGKAKIPRYLYHITTPENLEQIQARKVIQPTLDNLYGKFSGVFLLDLKNFTKRWIQKQIGHYVHLDEDLFLQCSHRGKELVLLKIPTKHIDKDSLKIRSMHKVFTPEGRKNHKTHIEFGENAGNQSLFTKRKEALEYFYQQYIPTENIEVIGHCQNFQKALMQGGSKAVLKELLKGRPEEQILRK